MNQKMEYQLSFRYLPQGTTLDQALAAPAHRVLPCSFHQVLQWASFYTERLDAAVYGIVEQTDDRTTLHSISDYPFNATYVTIEPVVAA